MLDEVSAKSFGRIRATVLVILAVLLALGISEPGRAATDARLVQGILVDQTDHGGDLQQDKEFIGGAEQIELRGNAFALEQSNGTGEVFLKLAPLPDFRGHRSTWDVRLKSDGQCDWNREDGYPWVSEKYRGGKWGRMAAAHKLQRRIRPYDPAADGLFLTNTWGDRSADSRVSEKFLLKEITAAARLGADVVQIDDGWQLGKTKNSASANGGGAWNGFWASNPKFWDVNPDRFPNGLQPLTEAARRSGVQIGLWFAPDSTHEAANWRRDADALLGLWKEFGIRFFKIDAIKITSPKAEENLRHLFEAVRSESRSEISFDFDVTAERRFGYFGTIELGRIFLENRYTDSRSYWPHETLRAAWKLSRWVDPVRLRLEWLNHARNAKKYGDSPLAPLKYEPDTLFAITMFCSPLGWFEVQNLPNNYLAEAGPLIAKWRQHREAIFNGITLPVGDEPDGKTWTGFVSVSDASAGYALVFRELNPADSWSIELPGTAGRLGAVEILGGSGTASLSGGRLQVTVPKLLGFVWVRYTLAKP